MDEDEDKASKKHFLPSIIGDHPWYVYVDPEINVSELQFVSEVLDDEYRFLEALLSGESQQPTEQHQQSEDHH